MMLCTCTSVVFSLMPSAVPICRFVRPAATWTATSSCRGVRTTTAPSASAVSDGGQPHREGDGGGGCHRAARVPLVLGGGAAQHAVEALVEVGQVPRLGLGREGGGPIPAGGSGADESGGRGRGPSFDSHLGHPFQGLGDAAPIADLVVQPESAGEEGGRPIDVGSAPPAYDRRGEHAGADRDRPVVVERVEQLAATR